MKTFTHNNKTIKFYDSPENLPLRRYQKFNKFCMQDAEIGSTFTDYQKRQLKSIEFVKKRLTKEALIEMENKAMCFYNAINEQSYKHYALAVMVHSIEGVEMEDISMSGLDLIIDRLDKIGVTEQMCNDVIFDIKKKSKKKSKSIFPRNIQVLNKVTGILKRKNKA